MSTPQAQKPDSLIKLSTNKAASTYINRAAYLLLGSENQKEGQAPQENLNSITFSAAGNAIPMSFKCAHVIRSKIPGLHQVMTISEEQIPLENGKIKHLSVIEIILTRSVTDVEKKAPGYSAPLQLTAGAEAKLDDIIKKPSFPKHSNGRFNNDDKRERRPHNGYRQNNNNENNNNKNRQPRNNYRREDRQGEDRQRGDRRDDRQQGDRQERRYPANRDQQGERRQNNNNQGERRRYDNNRDGQGERRRYDNNREGQGERRRYNNNRDGQGERRRQENHREGQDERREKRNFQERKNDYVN